MLHPRHKLAYFKTAGWEDSWIKTAENLVRDRFESDYNEIQTVDSQDRGPRSDTIDTEDSDRQEQVCH